MGAGMGLAMSPATEAIMGATTGLAPEQAQVAGDSVGGAHAVAAQLESGTARALVEASNHAFVGAMATTAGIVAVVALLGAAIAAVLVQNQEGPALV